jgi:adenosylmethionine-8-amino-7-oxononanoate aminotransferase
VAGLAAIAITEREDLLTRATEIGERLGDGLRTLVDKGSVAEVRAAGAVFGVGMHPHTPAAVARDALLEQGIIVRPIGDSTLALCPPLVITDEQIDACVEALATTL